MEAERPGHRARAVRPRKSTRSETGDAQILETVIIRVEVGDELFPAALPEEAGSGDGRYRQQADTEDANGDLPW